MNLPPFNCNYFRVKLDTLLFVLFLFAYIALSAQSNLLINGNLQSYEIDKLDTIDQWYERQIVGVKINNWEQNVCLSKYNPKYSRTNDVFIVANMFQYVSKKDVQINNVAGQMCRPMVLGNKYDISFYVKKYTGNGNSSSISVSFSEEKKENIIFTEHAAFTENTKMKNEPVNCYTNTIEISDADSFYHIQFVYQAKGGEQYIYIGNPELKLPKDWHSTKPYGYIKGVFNYSKWLMYAISDISITSFDTLETCKSELVTSSDYSKNNLIQNGDFESIELHKGITSDNNSLEAFENNDTAIGWNFCSHELIAVNATNWTHEEYDYRPNMTFYSDSGYARSGKMLANVTAYFLQNQTGNFSVCNLIGKVCHSLIKDSIYKFIFYIKPFQSKMVTNQVFVYLFNQYVTTKFTIENFAKNKADYYTELHHPIYQIPVIYDTLNYTKISFDFKARGGEQFIYIGNLNLTPCKDCIQVFDKTKKYKTLLSKYAIDDISIISANAQEKCSIASANSEIKSPLINSKIEQVFEDVTFAYNKAILNLSASNNLDSIARLLIQSKSSILILGYTDDMGSVEYNLNLSELRAKSVADYLIMKGVDSKKVTYIGKGIMNQEVEAIEKRKVRYIIQSL